MSSRRDWRTQSPAFFPHDSRAAGKLGVSETTTVRVIVAGEHRIFAAGFEHLFPRSFEVTTGSFGEPFLEQVARLQPHIIIKGLSTNVSKGLETLAKVRQAAPHS